MTPIRSTSLVLALLLTTVAARAQTRRAVPTPQEFVTTQDDSLFSLTRSQEDVHQWERAREDLAKGEFATAVERLHRNLQEEVGGSAAIGPMRFVGLRHALVLELANLPPAGVAAYEELVRREAGALHDQDPARLSPAQLAMLAEKFPAAEVGRRARLRLGDLALERGAAHEAASHFDLALESAPIGSDLEQRVLERRRCADALLRAPALRGIEIADEATRTALEAMPAVQDRTDWPAFGGGGDGSRPMTAPLGAPRTYFADEVRAPGFDDRLGGSYAMHATGGIDGLYVSTGLEVLAVDPLRRDLLWATAAPLRDDGELRTGRGGYDESINPNMVLAAAVSADVVVAALQVPDETSAVSYQGAFRIMNRMPDRRLFAFHRTTGKLLWRHFDGIGGPLTQRFRGHSASGPPLIVGDTVYAPVHDRSGAIAFYVGAYDLRTGQPRWRRLVCSSQQEVNMFGNARQEFAASPLCASQGLLLGASNLGVCYAVESASGRMRWVTSYEVVRMPAAQLQGQEPRPVFLQNSPPAVTDGVLCVTPLDSEYVLGLDVETGEPLWRVPFQAKANGNNDVRWLCGVLGDEFVLAGAGVVAVRARPDTPLERTPRLRQLRARDALLDDAIDEFPRPAIVRDQVWIPTHGGVHVVDREGSPVLAAPSLPFEAAGNLLLVDGMGVSLRNGAFEVVLDVEAMRQSAEARAKAAPDDPYAILRLCTLLAADEVDHDAELDTLYRRGIAAATAQGLPREHPVHAMFLRRLFDAAVARAERRPGSQAVALLLEARDLAPDRADFLRVQGLLLDRLRDDEEAFLREVNVLVQRASGESYALPDAGGTVLVEAWALWQRTLRQKDPAAAVAGWQELLRTHGDAVLQRQRASELARTAIDRLVARHGASVYARIEQEAATRLAAAGEDAARLRAVGAEFPNSDAARTAEQRLLDAAVRGGDLGTAIDVYARARREGTPAPTLLRRVAEAAQKRGNFALARGWFEALKQAPGASDWADDAGATFAAVAEARLAALLAEPARPGPALPADVVGELPNPSPPAPMRLVPSVASPGFVAAADTPLFLGVDDQIRAIDIADSARPTLWSHKSGGVERLLVCGRIVVVPTLERIEALDARTGLETWTYERADALLISHGVVEGVLLVTERRDDESLGVTGVEPLTGRVLFSRELPTAEFAPQPRPTGVDLLALQIAGADAPRILRLDPRTGETTASIALGESVQTASMTQPEVLRSPLMLQRFFGDRERVYVPIDGALRADGSPCVLALAADGSIAWKWTGQPGQGLAMEGLSGDRIAVVASGAPPRNGRAAVEAEALVLEARTGNVLRRIQLGAELQVLNWRRLRNDSPSPARLLLSDLDRESGDRRIVCLPVADGLEPFSVPACSATEDVVRSPWCSDELLVFATHSRRSTGPVRLRAIRLSDRSNALPGGRNTLAVAVAPRSSHELGTALAYTVLVTDSRAFVFGGGEDLR